MHCYIVLVYAPCDSQCDGSLGEGASSPFRRSGQSFGLLHAHSLIIDVASCSSVLVLMLHGQDCLPDSRSVYLERMREQKGKQVPEELCEADPQLPQGFNPIKDKIIIRPGDTLKATCMFDSSSVTDTVYAGATHNDEMCNLYLMLYSQLPFFMACYGSPQVDRHGMGGIPPEGRLEVPQHLLLS